MNNVDFIVSADIHARDTVPKSRKDDYKHAFLNKLIFLSELQTKYSCPILDAGDVFNTYEVSAELEAVMIGLCPKLTTIPGNHDLKEHSLPYFFKSSLNVLRKAGIVNVLFNKDLLKGFLVNEQIEYEVSNEIWLNEFLYKNYRIVGLPYGFMSDEPPITPVQGKINIAIIHDMVYSKDPIYTETGKPIGTNANLIMKQLKGFDLIISGHNHQSFIVNRGNQTLINPGSMMRTTVDQIDFIPGVFLWKNDQSYEFVPYPIEQNVISEEHIKAEHDKSERIKSYIEQLKTSYEIGLNFKKNLEAFLLTNAVDPLVETYIKNMKGK